MPLLELVGIRYTWGQNAWGRMSLAGSEKSGAVVRFASTPKVQYSYADGSAGTVRASVPENQYDGRNFRVVGDSPADNSAESSS